MKYIALLITLFVTSIVFPTTSFSQRAFDLKYYSGVRALHAVNGGLLTGTRDQMLAMAITKPQQLEDNRILILMDAQQTEVSVFMKAPLNGMWALVSSKKLNTYKFPNITKKSTDVAVIEWSPIDGGKPIYTTVTFTY